MTTTLHPALALSAPIPNGKKKKRVLLVDTSRSKCALRAEVMRKLGVDVDCTANITEARVWWRAGLYDLVLVNMEQKDGDRDKFCADVRNATPPQRLAFLIGQPDYLADSPNADGGMAVQNAEAQVAAGVNDYLSTDQRGVQRGGILEASRRISAVRSASIARTQAMQALPAPPRDSEKRASKPPAKTTSLDDLLREELR
jgi:CheY-like chemotaxis protein